MAEPRDDLQERVAELNGRLDELSTRLQKPAKRNVVDVLSSLSPLLSGVLIAAVGTIATIMYNNRQMQIFHWDALDKYRQYVMSDKPAERVFGYRAYVDLGEEQLVVDLIAAKKDSAGINVLTTLASKGGEEATQIAQASALIAQSATNDIMRNAISAEQQEIPEPLAATKITGAEGWAYLGHYVASTKKWKTRYFDFEDNVAPSDLEGKPFGVRKETGTLNVRASMPRPTGEFGKVIGVLKPGSKTKIYDVQEWRSTGYMWARITYGK